MTTELDDTVITDAMRLRILLARELRGSDRVHVGANQGIVLDAIVLAQEVYGTHIRMNAVGGLWLDRPGRAFGLKTYNRDAVERFDFPSDQERAVDNASKPVFVFCGGLQIDQIGNVNLIGVGREGLSWKVRGPGSAGLPSLTGLSSTFYAYAQRHDSQSLVERVEFISAVGSPEMRNLYGLPAITRGAIFTPLGRFSWYGKNLRLTDTAPGVSVEEVLDRSPFWKDLNIDSLVGSPISIAEKNWLKAHVDSSNTEKRKEE